MGQMSTLQHYPQDHRIVEPPLQCSLLREKEKKRESSHNACMGTLSCGHLYLIYRYWVCEIFTKTLIIISISSNILKPCVTL